MLEFDVRSVSAQAELPACPCPLWVAVVCFGVKKKRAFFSAGVGTSPGMRNPRSLGLCHRHSCHHRGDAPGGAAGWLPRSSCRKLEEPWGYSGKH